jgi:hypothetical protein
MVKAVSLAAAAMLVISRDPFSGACRKHFRSARLSLEHLQFHAC